MLVVRVWRARNKYVDSVPLIGATVGGPVAAGRLPNHICPKRYVITLAD